MEKNTRKIIFLLVSCTVCSRILFFFILKYVGIDWDYHVDSVYYVNKTLLLSEIGILDFFKDPGNDKLNSVFVIFFSCLFKIFGEKIELYNLMIFFNIFLSGFCVYILCLISLNFSQDKFPLAAIFFIFSPYLCYLSLHPLKDIFCIFLTLVFLFFLIRRFWVLCVVFAILLIFSRFYLGLMVVFFLSVLYLSELYKVSVKNYLLFVVAFMVFMLLVMGDLMQSRIFVKFSGRDFYPDGFELVSENLYIRFLVGGFLNFLVPYPFFPKNFAEIGYFAHWIFMMALVAYGIYARIKLIGSTKWEGQRNSLGFYDKLMVVCMFLFAFNLVSNPGAGPLVRYRLIMEIFMMMSFGYYVYIFRNKKEGV